MSETVAKPSTSNGDLSLSLEAEIKIKTSLKFNGIHEKVKEILVKDAGLKAAGFASLTQYVTVTFEPCPVSGSEGKPLNLFVKTETGNPAHTQFLTELKLFEKEATFFMHYVPEVREFCKLKG